MIQYPSRKTSANSIFRNIAALLIIAAFMPLISAGQEGTPDTGEHMAADILRIAIPAAAVSAALILASNEQFRWYFSNRWTRFTSPNHASLTHKTDFFIRTWEDNLNQETQCDRGVHFTFSYLPVIPGALLLDKAYSVLVYGKIEPGLSPWSVWTSSAVIGGLAVLEEYLDGHQLNEGFDFLDLAFNFTGIACAVLKYYGIMENVDFYWSFNRRMFEQSSVYGRYPWWIYMRGYEFAVNIDIMSLLTSKREDNTIFNLLIRTPGYLPDVKKLIYTRQI